jgi:hypothetical protein
MKIHKHNRQRGFIALFFTLSISTMLLVYVAASSASVFDFMRVRDDFIDRREMRMRATQCADDFIDGLIRSPYNPPSGVFGCSISHVQIVQIDPNTSNFSFISNDLYIKGSIQNGFVVHILSSNFSL